MKRLFSHAAINRFIQNFTLHAGRLADFVTLYRTRIQVVAGTIALTLGLFGWWQAHQYETDFKTLMDVFYRTAQLVTLQFPSNFRGDNIPVSLQIARLLLPTVALLASFQVLVSSITRPARLALLTRSDGHLIVCGSESLTGSALATLASRGRQVAVVAPRITRARREALEGHGLTIVEGDPLHASTIQSLHLSHAGALFLTADDDVANLNIAMLALLACRERPKSLPPMTLAVLIEREILAVELDAALDGLSRLHGVRYHRLCPDREGARLELSRFAPVFTKASLDAPSRVLIIGLAGNWQPIVAQIIAAAQDHPDKPAILTFIVDEHEANAVRDWHDARPELDLIAEISILQRHADAMLPADYIIRPWREAHGPPQLAVVLRGDADSVATALALRRPENLLGTEKVPILVHQTNEDRLLGHLGDIKVANRDMTRIVAIGGLVRAESIERVLDRKGEEIAIALHAQYAAKNQAAGSPAALQAWDELSENMREANRAAAEHAPILFAAAGFRIVPARPGIAAATLSPEDVERLARVEHRRWIADRIDRGWRHGAVRDDLKMLHPLLVPYDELNEENKQKDRDNVHQLFAILGKQGLALVRADAAAGP